MIKHITICLCCILVPLRIATSVSKKADVRTQYLLQEAAMVASQGMEQVQASMKQHTKGIKTALVKCVQDGVETLVRVVDTAPTTGPSSGS